MTQEITHSTVQSFNNLKGYGFIELPEGLLSESEIESIRTKANLAADQSCGLYIHINRYRLPTAENGEVVPVEASKANKMETQNVIGAGFEVSFVIDKTGETPEVKYWYLKNSYTNEKGKLNGDLYRLSVIETSVSSRANNETKEFEDVREEERKVVWTGQLYDADKAKIAVMKRIKETSNEIRHITEVFDLITSKWEESEKSIFELQKEQEELERQEAARVLELERQRLAAVKKDADKEKAKPTPTVKDIEVQPTEEEQEINL